MSTTTLLIRLFGALIPMIVIVAVCVMISVTTKKERECISADPLSGMRSPTEDEADLICRQVKPRQRTKAMVISVVYLPLIVIAVAVYLVNMKPDNLFYFVGAGFLVFGLSAFYLGMLSLPLSEIGYLRKKQYSVCECRITEIKIYHRFIRRSFIPIEVYKAIVQDERGHIWEGALPKEFRDISEGTRCLVLIYDVEDKINSRKNSGRPVFRRELIIL